MGNLELARLLLEHGADINAKDDEGKTPLEWVDDLSKTSELVDLLRKHGG